MIDVKNLSGGYGDKNIIQSVSFQVKKGELVGILGPNGSGKSTLLKLMSTILSPTAGKIEIDGKCVSTFTPKALARTIAVLPQLHSHAFSHAVKETVELGRYPHQTGFFASWTEADEAAVQTAMASTGVTPYADDLIELLSGGEQQRVFVAQAIAQQAPILLLDEPTNHLDIAHQQQLLNMIRKEAVDKQLTVLAVFHDINLASLYCDRLLLLDAGRIEKMGTPAEVVAEELIQEVYGAEVKTQPHPVHPKPQITLMPTRDQKESQATVGLEDFSVSDQHVVLQTKTALKTFSSAVHNAGMGWYRTFVNRHVDKQYNPPHVAEEMAHYLTSQAFSLAETVGMMTAAHTDKGIIRSYETSFGSVIIAVTAGLGNAVDVSKALSRNETSSIGTVNTWVIVNGHLQEEAFIQAIVTATEGKTKAFQLEEVQDPLTKTIATGTSTDSILVAATQTGEPLPYAGPLTELGQTIAHGVFECTTAAIRAYVAYRKEKGEDA